MTLAIGTFGLGLNDKEEKRIEAVILFYKGQYNQGVYILFSATVHILLALSHSRSRKPMITAFK